MSKAIGIFNGNWKAGNYYDQPEGEPLPARRVLEIRVETLRDVLKSTPENFADFRNETAAKLAQAEKELSQLDAAAVDQQVMRQVSAELVTQELAASHKTLATMPDEAEARALHADWLDWDATREGDRPR